VELTAHAPGFVAVRARSDGAGWVVFSEAWSRDWKAAVNGAPVEAVRANDLFIAVPAPAGDATVELRYRPASFTAGAALSGAALLALAAMAARRGRR
jgi:uncharacterized membrane protein YfhO